MTAVIRAAPPAATVHMLPDGMRVLTAPHFTGTMCATLFVTVGARHETRETSGVAHLLEHLFFSGTPRWPSQRAIATEIDSWGCRFNAMTDQEYTAYYVYGAAEHLPAAIEMLADLIRNAVLPAADLERERLVVLAELRARQDDQRQVSRHLANRALYGDTPMGWETVGFPDVLTRLDRDTLARFRAARYQPPQMILSVAGPVAAAEVADLAWRHFGAGPGTPGEAVEAPEPASYVPPVNLATRRDSRLAHLWLVGPGPSYASPARDMTAARMMNAIVGSSMSSRLFTAVRERQGLCYGIRSTLDPVSDAGAFLVATSVAPARAGRLVASVLDELERFAGEGPDRAELAKARAIVKSSFVLEREDVATLSRLSALDLARRGAVRGRVEHDALVDDITAAEVLDAARRYLDPAALRCALAGPDEALTDITAAGRLPESGWVRVA
jgi:predicted Zn-dependent peptidase